MGIIKHICLNKISLCMFAFHVKKKTAKKKQHKTVISSLFFCIFSSFSVFHKVRGCKRITDVLHLLYVFVIVFFFVFCCWYVHFIYLSCKPTIEITSFVSFMLVFFPAISSFKSMAERCWKNRRTVSIC